LRSVFSNLLALHRMGAPPTRAGIAAGHGKAAEPLPTRRRPEVPS